VSTDLHGNLADFERLHALFSAQRARDPDCVWVLLGDLVHGPNAAARVDNPVLYDYADESGEIVRRVLQLRQAFPEQVFFVLGNHEHGHVGGPHPGKFYEDEVVALESRLDQPTSAMLQELCAGALLLLLAPGGLVLCHGAPDERLADLGPLEALSLDRRRQSPEQRALLRSLLNSYGQTDEVAVRMLAQLSASTGLDLNLVVHGHDRDEQGIYTEGQHQVCPVIFGAPPASKHYLLLDLERLYGGVADLAVGREIRRLYTPEADEPTVPDRRPTDKGEP
jgi:hypothetical protein